MTTHARPRTATVPPGRLRRTWSITFVVLGSIATGLVAALTLTLGLLPGATEAVVTGSLLVGFGIGWGTLDVVSTRRTNQPQRWARVPAAAMATAGAALVALRPGDAGMTLLTWVWPPLLVALAVWTWGRARRSLPRPARALLAPVLVLLAAASVGAVVQGVSNLGAQQNRPAPGTTYAVGDHRLHLDCRGTGEPTVILFNGLGEFSGSWSRVVDQVGDDTRVCAYDRAGQGWSEDVEEPQDGVTAASDLHGLLAAAGVDGPYVLAGHSTGGAYALTYASKYPGDVAGVVLLDSSSPRQFVAMPDYPFQYALMRRGLALSPTLARIGLGPVTTPASHLPGPDGEVVDATSSTVRAKRNGRDELSMVPAVFEQAQALTTLGHHPLAVITASENLTTQGWAEEQERLAGLSSDSTHRVVQATHTGLLEDASGARASSEAISLVVRAVASASPVSTSRP